MARHPFAGPGQEDRTMARERKLPVCVKCGQAIRKSEYMQDADGAYHIVCPNWTPGQLVVEGLLSMRRGR